MLHSAKRFIINWIDNSGRKLTLNPLSGLLQNLSIDLVLDVGANRGQFASEIRRKGYQGRIESFEPLSQAHQLLQSAAQSDGLWGTHQTALGNEVAQKEINISSNQPSSSFRDLDEDFHSPNVNLDYVGTETVKIDRLDNVFEDLRQNCKRVYLKIDTQGYEKDVIEGGLESLNEIAMVQMELSLVPNYDGEALIEEMIAAMRERNFVPWWVMDGFKDKQSYQLFQADVFFLNQRFR